jgi:hypothetical protein
MFYGHFCAYGRLSGPSDLQSNEAKSKMKRPLLKLERKTVDEKRCHPCPFITLTLRPLSPGAPVPPVTPLGPSSPCGPGNP